MLWIVLLIPGKTFSQEYSFDLNEFEKKPYSYSAILSLNPRFSLLAESSRLYRLKYLKSQSENFLDEYNLSLEAKGSYEFRKIMLVSSGKYDLSFNSDSEWIDDLSLYELYAQYSMSTNFTAWLGKKTVKWGKGYIWNPVSFVGKQKDINDVDASLEGYSLLMGEYVKSFEGMFRTMAISPVIIPVGNDLNDDFSADHGFNFALQIYTLISDTDIGVYLFANDQNHRKSGVDFAKNLLTNWEIHAE
ncbi:hypothetical protein K8T06_06200 [bacterium]|nr:hypothetical protein [bacterium]